MPYGITQCCLPPDSGENPAFTPMQPKQVLDLATPEGCKAELTYVTVRFIKIVREFYEISHNQSDRTNG